MTAYPTWLPGVAWIYPTYAYAYGSELAVGSTTVVLSSLYHDSIVDLITDLDARLVSALAPDWRIAVHDATLGTLRIYGSTPATLTARDRLLFALGYDLECGETLAAATEHFSRMPSPLAVPLQECVPERVDREREKAFRFASFRRGFGDSYGAADIWRFSAVLDAPALRAWKAGYAQGGRVMVSPYNIAQHQSGLAQAWTPDELGYIEGQLIGIESGDWIDPKVRQFYRCTFLVATAVT